MNLLDQSISEDSPFSQPPAKSLQDDPFFNSSGADPFDVDSFANDELGKIARRMSHTSIDEVSKSEPAGDEDPFAMLDFSGQAPAPAQTRRHNRSSSMPAPDIGQHRRRKSSLLGGDESDAEEDPEVVKKIEELKEKAKKEAPQQKPNQQKLRPQLKVKMNVDVLSYMKKGTSFLKYGKRGYPHFRNFQISDDNMRLVWFSKAKKLRDTQIEFADIQEIRMGQTTPVFKRHPAPELARSSFSVIYKKKKRVHRPYCKRSKRLCHLERGSKADVKVGTRRPARPAYGQDRDGTSHPAGPPLVNDDRQRIYWQSRL